MLIVRLYNWVFSFLLAGNWRTGACPVPFFFGAFGPSGEGGQREIRREHQNFGPERWGTPDKVHDVVHVCREFHVRSWVLNEQDEQQQHCVLHTSEV